MTRDRRKSPFAMRELHPEARDLPLARTLVWTGILAATAAFWAIVATRALARLRHG
jgi:hypothetical protein